MSVILAKDKKFGQHTLKFRYKKSRTKMKIGQLTPSAVLVLNVVTFEASNLISQTGHKVSFITQYLVLLNFKLYLKNFSKQNVLIFV